MNTEHEIIDDGRPAQEIAAERFHCDCKETTRLTVFRASNSTTHYRLQCHRCGSFTPVKKTDLTDLDRERAEPFDAALQTDWVTKQYEFGRAIHQARREASRVESLQSFRDEESDFLESPVWDEMQRLVLWRAGGTCEGCLKRPATVVHHTNYIRKFGHEMLFDLRAVCRQCHEAIHNPAHKRASQ